MLLSLNHVRKPAPSGKVTSVGPVEFKKLVYESTFTKLAEGVSFVNSSVGARGQCAVAGSQTQHCLRQADQQHSRSGVSR